ncbi:MAG: S-methyl-5-thioribose-1-phosphate isomerase [bacterium]|jgi:methylthioribose-1-phosphate isomerase
MHEPPVKPIEWLGDSVRIIDQRALPGSETHVEIAEVGEFADAIKTLAVRGAPLIGIAAAMGVAVEAKRRAASSWDTFEARVTHAINELNATRPTAVNLFWALGRMRGVLNAGKEKRSSEETAKALEAEALRIYEEDLEMGYRIGEIGAGLIKDGFTVLTHCNAGGLATSGFGTAIAPVYVAHSRGTKVSVIADETRPLLQGARLTAWELKHAGIDVTVVCDSAAHLMMARGKVDIAFVGADRITSSGDFANKIGTYGVALSASANGVPFYVAAPSSTIDFDLATGDQIPIEERAEAEVTTIGGTRIVPEGVRAANPAFDVTPAGLVTGIITEMGLFSPPFDLK